MPRQLDEKAKDLLTIALTLLGLFKVAEGVSKVEMVADELLGAAGILFLLALMFHHFSGRDSGKGAPGAGSPAALRAANLSYELGLVVLLVGVLLLVIGVI